MCSSAGSGRRGGEVRIASYSSSSSVRAVLHGVSGKFLAVRNHRTD